MLLLSASIILPVIKPFPDKPWFLRVCSTSLLKTLWKKEKSIETSNFSFFHIVFYPIWRTFCHLYHIQECRLQTRSIWTSLKFVVWEKVTGLPPIFRIHQPFLRTFFVLFSGQLNILVEPIRKCVTFKFGVW